MSITKVELDKCRKSPAYFYNTYIRKPEDRKFTDEELKELTAILIKKRGPKP